MVSKIKQYIKDNLLFDKNETLLLGISGGRDSVCLAIALKKIGYSIGLAHCNFTLRGEESEQDENFVKSFASKNNIPLFNIAFDTKKLAKEKNISIQMAARDLRYNWFEKIRLENNYNYIAIAHNRDDIIETFFINLIRGTGIEGLSGIKAKNGKIVRPLLSVSREEIDNYIVENSIKYREDSSNASTKYIRNKLRHNILPEFKAISEQFDQTMTDNIERINKTNQVYKNEIKFKRSKIFIELSDRIKINIDNLQKLNPLSSYLYEFLKEYNFSVSTIEDIISALDSESGKQFFSSTHQITKDRNELILTEISKTENTEIFLAKENFSIINPINLELELLKTEGFVIPKTKETAALDLDKLSFPLILRKWKHGDYFMPLGMKKMKKLSDFLINNKVSMVDKENTFVIQSKNDIVWIVGHRIDDRYKVTEESKNVALLKTYGEIK